MASPAVGDVGGSGISTAADPWTVTPPGGVQASDFLYVMMVRTAGTQTFNLPSGWTTIGTLNDVSDATDDATSFICRSYTVAGNESFDMSGSAKGIALGFRISGAATPAERVPEIFGPTNFTTAANSADPPNATPSEGSKDYLFLTFCGYDGEGGAPSAAPTNYVNLGTLTSGTGGAVATNNNGGCAARQLTTGSAENPNAFTHPAAANGGNAWTLIVHPPPAPARGKLVVPKIQAVVRAAVR